MPAESPIVILIRHGRTKGNTGPNPVVRAWSEFSLSREGLLDAELAAQQLKKFDPKMVYSSDLNRDRQTAEIISSSFDNIPYDCDFELRTANVGDLEEQPEADTREIAERWYKEPWWQVPGGESLNEFLRRWYPAFDAKFDLAKECEACRPSVIVTHGRNIAAIHARSEMIPQCEAQMTIPGGLSLVYLDSSLEPKIEFLSRTEPILEDI